MALRRPTISDVARSAGVSKGAVSFALNDRPGRGAGDAGPDPAAAAELGWTPSHRARALAASRALAVGLVIGRPPETLGADPFFPALHRRHRGGAVAARPVAGAAGRARPGARARRLPPPRRRRAGRRRLPHRPARRRPPPRAARRARPAGRLDRSGLRRRRAAPCVAVDDRPGIAAAVAHLVQLGHRRIAHVAGPDEFVHGVSRREAWAGALRAAGPGRRDRASGPTSRRRAARDATERAARPARAAHRDRLRQRPDGHRRHGGGRRPRRSTCPGDLSITGFDDTEVTAPPPARRSPPSAPTPSPGARQPRSA